MGAMGGPHARGAMAEVLGIDKWVVDDGAENAPAGGPKATLQAEMPVPTDAPAGGYKGREPHFMVPFRVADHPTVMPSPELDTLRTSRN